MCIIFNGSAFNRTNTPAALAPCVPVPTAWRLTSLRSCCFLGLRSQKRGSWNNGHECFKAFLRVVKILPEKTSPLRCPPRCCFTALRPERVIVAQTYLLFWWVESDFCNTTLTWRSSQSVKWIRSRRESAILDWLQIVTLAAVPSRCAH